MSSGKQLLIDIRRKLLMNATQRTMPPFILETICYLIDKNAFIYFAEPLNNIELVNNIISIAESISLQTSIIVEERQFEVKRIYYKNVSAFVKVLGIEKLDPKDLSTVVIIDGVTTVSQFMSIEKLLHNIYSTMIVVALVNSPFLFIDLIRAGISLNYFTPVKYDDVSQNFYKSIIEDSNLISFESFEEALKLNDKYSSMIKFYEGLDNEGKKVFEYLNRNGAYTGKLFKQLKGDINPLLGYKSDKIIVLTKILKILKDRKNCLIVKDENILRHILDYYEGEGKIQKIKFNTELHNVNVEIFPHAKLNIFDENNYDNVIFFDLYPIKLTKTKYIFCGGNEKVLFKKLLAAEEIIETEIKSKIISNTELLDNLDKQEEESASNEILSSSLENSRQETLRSYQFKVLIENRNYKAIKSKLSSITSKVFYTANSATVDLKTTDPLKASFLLSRILNTPVSYPESQICPFTYTTCNSFSVGHINYYDSFITKKEFGGLGYLFFNLNTISFFYFSKQMNIRFDIDIINIEKKLFFDMFFDNLYLYFGLKNYPKVYTLKQLSSHELEDIKFFPLFKKYALIDGLEWERASINEFPFFENAYDLKFKINLKWIKSRVKHNDSNADETIIRLINYYKTMHNDSRNKEEGYSRPQNGIGNTSSSNLKKQSRGSIDNSKKQGELQNELNNLNNNSYLMQTLLNKMIQYQLNPLVTHVKENYRPGKTLDELRRKFSKLEFSDYYFLEVLFTKKDRFIDNKINNLELFKGVNIKKLVNYLDVNYRNRFLDIEEVFEKFKVYSLNSLESDDYNSTVRQIIVTPFRIKCLYPHGAVSNRVLRNFDNDKFIRVAFKDDDGFQIRKGDRRDNTRIYDNIKKVMKNGILIGERKFFFLAMSSSQLKLHSAWFVTPYILNDTLIGADYIRSWLGDFKPIHNIGKYAIRLGQGLSSTINTVDIDNINEISDIERNGYCFSDGIGQISYELASQVTTFLKTNEIPSAFQIRIGGYKGVVSLLSDKSKHIVPDYIKKPKSSYSRDNEIDLPKENAPETKKVLSLRNSMKKFDSNHKNLEIITYSQNLQCNLNRQIIIILESLGINSNTFLEMQDNIISRFILSDPLKHIKKHCSDFPLRSMFEKERFFLKMFEPVLQRTFEELVKKTRVPICKGRLLMGILDEYDVLEENEIFIRCSSCIDCVCNNDKIQVICGKVAIAKNPCLHPGDIRIVTAVNRSALLHLKDVVVFSKKGPRPIFNMCSGSDLDGDHYFCTWDPRLIPSKVMEPDNYTAETVLYKQVVSMDDIINFYARFMRENQLGLIANAHLALSDLLPGGVNEKECIRLAQLFNLGVDFPKTGFVPRLPFDLQPESYPDFMELSGNYQSQKVLGLMYRRVQIFSKLVYYDCECQGTPSSYLKNVYDFKCRNILKILNANLLNKINKENNISKEFMNIYNGILAFENETKLIFQRYKQDVNLFLHRFGFKNEYEAFLGFNKDEEYDKVGRYGIREITKKYRAMFLKDVSQDVIHYKAFSWYKVSQEKCNETNLSFCWIIGDVLSKYYTLLDSFLKEMGNKFNMDSTIQNMKSQKEDVFRKENEASNNISDLLIKLRSKNVKHIHFKLNNAIIFVESMDDIKFLIKEGKEKPYYIFDNHIIIPKYLTTYETYENRINDTEYMREIFLLFYSIRFFVLENIRCMLEFFAYLSGLENKDPSKSGICNSLIIMSQESYRKRNNEQMTGDLYEWIYTQGHEKTENRGNIILLISFIFSLRHKLGIKLLTCESFYFKDNEVFSKQLRDKNVCFYKKRFGLSIIGMFDACDLIYVKSYDGNCLQNHTAFKKYSLSLLNPGICSVENYKDDLRVFLLQNAAYNNNGLINIKVKVIPGKLYYCNLSDYYTNNNIEIRDIMANTIFIDDKQQGNENYELKNKLMAHFINEHPLLEKENKEFIIENSMSVCSKECLYVLHLTLRNIRYCIYYEEIEDTFDIKRITRNRIVSGRYVISSINDVLFEIIKEEIIFCRGNNVNILDEHENDLLLPLFSKADLDENNNETYDLISCKTDITDFKLNVIKKMGLKNKRREVIQVILKYIYKNMERKGILSLDSQATNSYCGVENCFTDINFKSFDGFFEDVWQMYNGYFCIGN